jgi:hypothetical protein
LNASIPKLKIPKQSEYNFENTSTRSRNFQNNVYISNNNNSNNNPFILSNAPSKVFFTSERNKKENLNISKQKSVGSTIFKELLSLENIMKDEKSLDVIPINNAMKPVPKSLNHSNDKIRNRSSSFVLEPEGNGKYSEIFVPEYKRKMLNIIEEENANNNQYSNQHTINMNNIKIDNKSSFHTAKNKNTNFGNNYEESEMIENNHKKMSNVLSKDGETLSNILK